MASFTDAVKDFLTPAPVADPGMYVPALVLANRQRMEDKAVSMHGGGISDEDWAGMSGAEKAARLVAPYIGAGFLSKAFPAGTPGPTFDPDEPLAPGGMGPMKQPRGTFVSPWERPAAPVARVEPPPETPEVLADPGRRNFLKGAAATAAAAATKLPGPALETVLAPAVAKSALAEGYAADYLQHARAVMGGYGDTASVADWAKTELLKSSRLMKGPLKAHYEDAARLVSEGWVPPANYRMTDDALGELERGFKDMRKPAESPSVNEKPPQPSAEPSRFEQPAAELQTKSVLPEDIRPAKENLNDLVDANFEHGRVVGDEMAPIDSLTGGTRSSSPSDSARVQELAGKIGGEGGYIERVVVDDLGHVIEGQHRLDALRRMGATEVPITRIKELTRGLDVPGMKAAIREAGPIRSDHVNQIVRQVAEMVDEAGSVEAVRSNYDMPEQFKPQFDAALKVAERAQPLTRQALAKSGAPLEARTNALMEGIDKAIELGKKVRTSVNSYVGSAYETLNKLHRTGDLKELDRQGFSKDSTGGQQRDVKYREISDHLDHAISKSKLQGDMTLYRGVGQTLAGELSKLKPGQTITDRGFMSTSQREDVANGFASGSGIMRTLIEIKAPKGAQALDIGLLTKRNVEKEVIFPRGTELKYVGRTSRFNKNLTPVYQFELVSKAWPKENATPTSGLRTTTGKDSSSSTPMDESPTPSGRKPRPSYRSPSRSAFGDSRELMFDPPRVPQRAFEEDYPNGARHDGSGIITRDIEGRPLTAPFVAGRTVVGAPDRPINPAHYDAVAQGTVGSPAQEMPNSESQKRLGGTYFNELTKEPTDIEIRSDVKGERRRHVYAHELGHVLDQFAGEIPTAGLEKELGSLYNALNNPIRTRGDGGNNAHPWAPRTTPEKHGYKGDEIPREWMAEAGRAYIQNPNYIKSVAPKTAARLRKFVNEHPWLKQTIQLNSLAGLGIIATEHDEQ